VKKIHKTVCGQDLLKNA